MRNVLAIAKREFLATVATRAFVLGLLIFPALLGVFALVFPRMLNERNFEIRGQISVIDPTGQVTPRLEEAFDTDVIAARRLAEAREALENAPEGLQQLAGAAIDANPEALGTIPQIAIRELAPNTNLEAAKSWLLKPDDNLQHMAVIVIDPDAVEATDSGLDYGSFAIYIPQNLADQANSEIRRGLSESIVGARLQARSLDQETVDAVLNIPAVRSVTVTETEERETVRGFNMILPMAFGILLLMGVMGGGGQLLTTMVEEKSSRVVEVLLSAVSPMELMAGKLVGQAAVSLIGMSLYIAMGMVALASFALFGLLDVSLIGYLLIFFLITYLVMGSLMMAVGSSVNDMREAQGLMMPLMMVFMIPWFLWFPISRNPDSTLSVVVSFVPPLNTFGMMLRLASSSPPPGWQVWLSIGIGIASVVAAVWFASKIFRIGLLMFGKPPNIRTLIRWVRAA